MIQFTQKQTLLWNEVHHKKYLSVEKLNYLNLLWKILFITHCSIAIVLDITSTSCKWKALTSWEGVVTNFVYKLRTHKNSKPEFFTVVLSKGLWVAQPPSHTHPPVSLILSPCYSSPHLPTGMHSKTPRGCLKPRGVPNPM